MPVKEPERGQTVSQAVNELLRGVASMVAAEVNLAQAEANEAFARTRANGLRLLLSVGIAVISIPPFVAFLVIGIGKLLNDRYWLSSLLVSILLAVLGATLSLLSLRSSRLKLKALSLPETRKSLELEKQFLKNKISVLNPRSKAGGLKKETSP